MVEIGDVVRRHIHVRIVLRRVDAASPVVGCSEGSSVSQSLVGRLPGHGRAGFLKGGVVVGVDCGRYVGHAVAHRPLGFWTVAAVNSVWRCESQSKV